MFPFPHVSGHAGGASSIWIAGIDPASVASVHVAQRSEGNAPHELDAPDGPKPADGVRPLRILLVDDIEDAVRSVERLLELFGYVVKGVTHGREALAVGEAFAPDLVLLDLGMPDMDGYEVAAAIRAQPWGRRVRIVALTGWGEPENVRRSLDAGFEAHLVKPLNLEELQKVLDRRES